MVRAHTFSLLIAALALLSALAPARALQLGESMAQIKEKHGDPGAEDRAKNVAIYFWEGWSAEIEYKEDAVRKLVYRRNSYLEPAEVTALLQSNGGLARWREATSAGDDTRQWVRDDGALASCLSTRPLMMTFQAGMKAPPKVVRYGGQGALKNAVPDSDPAGSISPPRFPKMLGAAENESSPTAAAGSPAGQPRALPKLQAEEINPTAGDAPKSRLTRISQAAPDGTENIPDNGANAVPYVTPVDYTVLYIWLGAIGAVVGAGVYWMKFRAPREGGGTGWKLGKRSKTSKPEVIVRDAPPAKEVTTPARPTSLRSEAISATMAGPASGLDRLRSDQYELLVGEIFRREGYTVELSGAAAQGDSIDLTLRRDSETILVECKHWKTPRVTEKEIAEFYQAMMANGAPRGVFVTAGCFSREAQQFAEGKSIDLMDRVALEECVEAVTRRGEDFCSITPWIAEFAANSRIFDPECPTCRGSMVIRNGRASGMAAWTCRNHPRCPGRRNPRMDLVAAAAAQFRGAA